MSGGFRPAAQGLSAWEGSGALTLATCPVCGADLGSTPGPRCEDCGTIFKPDLRPLSASLAPPAAPAHVCPGCHSAMTFAGVLQFRVGGSVGGVGMILGEWNQLSERLQPFSVHHCPGCGRIDLYEAGK